MNLPIPELENQVTPDTLSTQAAGQEFLTLHEIIQSAHQNLNGDCWDYIVGGSETETTLERNRAALDAISLRPRVLHDVSSIDASTVFLGQKLRLPLVMAPVGSLELFTPAGAAATAQAAREFGVAHMLSSVCAPGLEEVAKAAPDAMRLFQLYVHGDAAWVDDIVQRTQDNGYSALCLTVDTAVYSRRERDLSRRNIRRQTVPGREHQPRLTWADVDRIKRNITIPLILKGIATPEDARMAIEHGVDMVYVSNHGGRQLDHGRGSMEVLPEIVQAVQRRAAVIVDGGFCRGTDIVKALAVGADMVGLGRMQCYALAADGARGLVRMLELLESEVTTCLGLLGVTDIKALNRSFLHFGQPVGRSSVLSAFPLLSATDGTPHTSR